MKDFLNVAVIGTGNISRHHLQAYAQNPRVRIVALCDVDEDKLREKGEQFNVEKRYVAYRKMLDECPEIDAVSVCTWNSEHAPAAICALQHGKNVLCEKPMADTVAAAERMVAAEKASKGRLMPGFVRRFGNDAEIVKDFIDNGYLGDLYYAKATYIRRNGCPGGWFTDKAFAGGGPLIDLGVHVIDLVRYLAGSPQATEAFGTVSHRLGMKPYQKGAKSYDWNATPGQYKTDCEDFAAAMVRFDGGMTLQVETSFTLHTGQDRATIELYGTKGGVTLSPELAIHTNVNGYPVDMTFPVPTALSFDGLFDKEVSHFVDCCLDGKPFRATGDDGLEMMKILDSIYASAGETR